MPAVADLLSPSDPLTTEPWPVWLYALLPGHCTAEFAPHHIEFWTWVWSIELAAPVDEAFVGVWPRGGAKSTSAEAAVAALGARNRRRYGWYISGTQDQADQHVENIGGMLESERFEMFYPAMARRLVGKYGNSRGWRRNRLRTATGFTVDAIGLDKGARGVKVEDQRPDFLVIDDVDDSLDTPETTRKKIDLITRKLLPAGSPDVVVLAIQNLVHANSVFSRLADGRAEFLTRRHVSGPIPAVRGLQTVPELADGKIRNRIVAGEPTWAGQSLDVCQRQIDDWGLPAFSTEAQHEVDKVDGALWCAEQINAQRVLDYDLVEVLRGLERIVTAVDPAATSGPSADDTGIVVAGRTGNDCPVCGPVDAPHAFVLADRTCHESPAGWAQKAIDAHDEFEGDEIVGETNNGGEMVEHTVHTIDPLVPFDDVHASRGKRTRAEPIAALYGNPDDERTWALGRVHHLGTFPELEEQQTTWLPGATASSPDRLDALVWALTQLMVEPQKRRMRYRGAA